MQCNSTRRSGGKKSTQMNTKSQMSLCVLSLERKTWSTLSVQESSMNSMTREPMADRDNAVVIA